MDLVAVGNAEGVRHFEGSPQIVRESVLSSLQSQNCQELRKRMLLFKFETFQ
jgi:hypothetical protein